VSEKMFNRALTVAAGFLLVVLLLMATGASAQSVADKPLTHPKWVADSPATGQWLLTLSRAATDTTSDGVRAIECHADTETKFVAYWYKRSAGTDRQKWAVQGVAAGDTCYTVPAGETRTYTFDKPFVQFIIVTSGDAVFAGE
jgi:hypothetical protein